MLDIIKYGFNLDFHRKLVMIRFVMFRHFPGSTEGMAECEVARHSIRLDHDLMSLIRDVKSPYMNKLLRFNAQMRSCTLCKLFVV